jgi:hypothetical protein
VRDIFDCYKILGISDLDKTRLRTAFVVYGAMNRRDWREISVEELNLDQTELMRQLVSTLRFDVIQNKEDSKEFGQSLIKGCRQVLFELLLYNAGEKKFLDLLLDRGEIDPTLLTDNLSLQDRIRRQPLLEWKALNVRRYKGLT